MRLQKTSTAAVVLLATASGAVTAKTTVLMTLAEVDEAAKKTPVIARRDNKYRSYTSQKNRVSE